MNSNDDFAAGASAARNELASYFRENGIKVLASENRCPPTDTDFLEAILAFYKDSGIDHARAHVVFKWQHNQYDIPVSIRVLDQLRSGAILRYDLFTANSHIGSHRGKYTLHLLRDNAGRLRVCENNHRWGGTADVPCEIIIE